jgi:uncharacterized protein with ATP-grasp and redox domains
MLGFPEDRTGELMAALSRRIPEIDLADPPPKTAVMVYELINAFAGSTDPFREVKEEGTRRALALYPGLKETVAASDDPVGTAVRLAVAGNVIDLGVSATYDLKAELERILDEPSGPWEEAAFRRAVEDAEWILYLGDNAGETVFDRLLIETLGHPTTYAVRGRPIINDATLEDAAGAGLGEVATLVSSGCSAPGTILDQCTDDFRSLFRRAPLIVSKGQGNYESLSHVEAPVFFLLKAKCQVVSRHLGARLGDLVITTPVTEAPRDGESPS